jgi:MFS family permease
MVAGLVCRRSRRFQKLIWSGWVLFTIGTGLMIFMTPHSNGMVLYGCRVLSGSGAGILFPTNLFAVQSNQDKGDVGMATSLAIFFRSLGQAFGVAIGGVIFQNQFDRSVKRSVLNKPDIYQAK